MISTPVLDSHNSPLQLGQLSVGPRLGAVGFTICPGKKQANSVSGHWRRDMDVDLDTIRRWGAAAVVTLMPMDELHAVQAGGIGDACEARGMEWHHLPITDVDVPDAAFEAAWCYAGLRLRAHLRQGLNVLVHCRGGLGRSGTIAARLLVELGWSPAEAIKAVRAQRKGAIETAAQEKYVHQWAGAVPPERDLHDARVLG
ncbi:MAG TPA: cyclin-dependent kinase inhibitor 3 family protein, partial [Ottowia sp.]|nr:cyclin-dependent kinase inhibitor 3 family protein [Ottowia sp.]